MKQLTAIIVCAGALTAATAAFSPVQAQCTRQSPEHTVALVELYTSEGCNSCPPADQWLGGFGATHAPNSVIPLALHVHYWDYIGWKDKFADVRFAERQSALTRLARGKVVYTPGVFLNLREFRDWRSETKLQQAVAAINARPARAVIRIALDAQADGRLAVAANFQVKPAVKAVRPQAYVAIYENALTTDVKAGENRGVMLRHDYVVRRWIGPIEFSGSAVELAEKVVIEPGWRRANLGVAAFVQEAGSLDVLQATALKVCS